MGDHVVRQEFALRACAALLRSAHDVDDVAVLARQRTEREFDIARSSSTIRDALFQVRPSARGRRGNTIESALPRVIHQLDSTIALQDLVRERQTEPGAARLRGIRRPNTLLASALDMPGPLSRTRMRQLAPGQVLSAVMRTTDSLALVLYVRVERVRHEVREHLRSCAPSAYALGKRSTSRSMRTCSRSAR